MKIEVAMRSVFALGIALASPLLQAGIASAATFVINVVDGPGEGFNDPSPVVPAGGNPGLTLGSARTLALGNALDQIGCHLDSAVPIQVNAAFDPLSCGVSSGAVGSGGAISASKNFPNAPLPDTYYAIALANSLAGVDLDTTGGDVFVTFNSGLGSPSCLPGSPWYYGFDSQTPSGSIDFVTIAMHETVHGLGFHTYVDLSTGEKLLGDNDAFMLNLDQLGVVASYADMTDAQRMAASVSEPNLVWGGGHVVSAFGTPARMYAPSPLQPGSSVNHFAYSQLPNELMSPFFIGPTHSLGLALGVLADSSWSARTACVAPVAAAAAPSWGAALLACSMTLAGFFSLHRRRHVR